MYFEKYRRGVALAIAGLLVLAGGMGAVYALRAAMAQNAYRSLKYGTQAGLSPPRKSNEAERAHQLYRHNYYLSLLLAQESWQQRSGMNESPAAADFEALASHWMARGLAQNPYRQELVWLKANLLAQDEPALAAEVWARYVDGVFWNALNLAELVRFYAEADRVESALVLLGLLRGRPEHARAVAAFEHAWQRLLQPPPLQGAAQPMD